MVKKPKIYGKVPQCLRYSPVVNVPTYHTNPSSTTGIYYRNMWYQYMYQIPVIRSVI